MVKGERQDRAGGKVDIRRWMSAVSPEQAAERPSAENLDGPSPTEPSPRRRWGRISTAGARQTAGCCLFLLVT